MGYKRSYASYVLRNWGKNVIVKVKGTITVNETGVCTKITQDDKLRLKKILFEKMHAKLDTEEGNSVLTFQFTEN